MLNVMRASPKLKIVLLTLFILAMGGLGLVNQGTFMGHGSSSMTVATVGGGKITRQEFDQGFEATLRQRKISRQDAIKQGLPEQQLLRDVNGRMYGLLARDLGMLVSDDVVRSNIRKLVQPLMERGMDEKQAFQQMLYIYDTNEQAFVDLLRNQIATEDLVHTLADGARAPGQMLDDALRYRYQWRRGKYFKLTADDVGPLKDPSDDALKAYYKTVSDRFMIPEYRNFSVLVLDKAAAGDKPTAQTDAAVKAYYEKNIATYSVPETRTIEQIIVSTQDEAKKAYDAAKAGKSLKDLTKTLGKDKASYVENTYAATALPDVLAGAFTAKAGEIMAPVQSPLGWHVLHIEKIVQASPKPFDSVKADVVKAMNAAAGGDDVSNALYKLANDVDDMVGGGQNLSEVAAHYHLKLHTFKMVDAKGLGVDGKKVQDDGVPAFDKVLKTAFAGQKGVPSEEIETNNGDFVLVQPDDIFKEHTQDFDKVRAQVLAAWRADAENRALDDKSAKLMERLKLGESFDKVAASVNKQPVLTDFVQRQEQAAKDQKLERGMVPALFSIDKEGGVTTVNGTNDIVFLQLEGRKIDMPSDMKREDMDTLRNMLGQSIQVDVLYQFRKYLSEKYDVKTYPDVLKDMYKKDANTEDYGG